MRGRQYALVPPANHMVVYAPSIFAQKKIKNYLEVDSNILSLAQMKVLWKISQWVEVLHKNWNVISVKNLCGHSIKALPPYEALFNLQLK